MPTKLSDLREHQAMTIEDADSLMKILAQSRCAIELAKAAFEVAATNAKAAFNIRIAAPSAQLTLAEKNLTAYIEANRDRFQKPRQRKTEFGAYGLRTATKVEVKDEEAVLAHVMENGYPDCFTTVHKLDLGAIQKRLAAGEKIPGAALAKGDIASYTVAKSLIEKARKGALQ